MSNNAAQQLRDEILGIFQRAGISLSITDLVQSETFGETNLTRRWNVVSRAVFYLLGEGKLARDYVTTFGIMKFKLSSDQGVLPTHLGARHLAAS